MVDMRQSMFDTMVFGFMVLLCLISHGTSAAQEKMEVRDLNYTARRDLVYTIKDMGGKVQDIKVKESGTEIRIELAADVLFDFDKSDIRPSAQEALNQAGSVVRDKARGVVRIEGHTDSKGSDAYNQKLSERRANSVKEWLLNKEGLKGVKFEARGFGSKKPVAQNTKPDGPDDPEGRQKNRRVEIIIAKK
jgi:outer membrane protein OmpA-like peptidoglycan-associated protein